LETTLNEPESLLSAAREHFKESRHKPAEALLNQLILRNFKHPEVFHMLGTIYYDQGKFNKAIRSFRRALEINPSFTDASVGLSIILNDLGKYDDAKKVFDEAKVMLDQRSLEGDPYINEKLSVKHDELAELYFRYRRYNEALEQYLKALQLSGRKAEITMKVADCYILLEQPDKAIKHLRDITRDYPDYLPARLKLGKTFYDAHRIPEAVDQWEAVIGRDPDNHQAKDYLRLAQSVELTMNENNRAEL
jgi:tetratricopeptide (TPR) repeat protein